LQSRRRVPAAEGPMRVQLLIPSRGCARLASTARCSGWRCRSNACIARRCGPHGSRSAAVEHARA
jgi:hypothetical protein